MSVHSALVEQYEVVLDRKRNPSTKKSYTNYLFSQGVNKILKKCGEETFEAVIAAKSGDVEETLGELGDVLYHVTVLLALQDVTLDAVFACLNRRCQRESDSVDALADVIAARRGLPVYEDAKEGSSYTAYLFQQGTDKILKKVGEACALFLLAAKDNDAEAVAEETADLLYHLLVMCVNEGISMEMLGAKLDERNGKTGNLKVFHKADHNS